METGSTRLDDRRRGKSTEGTMILVVGATGFLGSEIPMWGKLQCIPVPLTSVRKYVRGVLGG
jgi:hypothetical protein